MINANDAVKLNGAVKETGTGTFTISVNEFYVDGVWHKLNEAKEFEVTTKDYNNEFTALELKYIGKVAAKDSKSTTLCEDDMEVVNSIVKKVSNNASID
jgi:peroxiredoxin